MKEFAFILALALILLVVTAFRYRKQISGVIGFVRMIRTMADSASGKRSITSPAEKAPSELVRCSRCTTWVPKDRSIRFDAITHYCSRQCVKSAIGN